MRSISRFAQQVGSVSLKGTATYCHVHRTYLNTLSYLLMWTGSLFDTQRIASYSTVNNCISSFSTINQYIMHDSPAFTTLHHGAYHAEPTGVSQPTGSLCSKRSASPRPGSGGLVFELADEWWKDGEGSTLAAGPHHWWPIFTGDHHSPQVKHHWLLKNVWLIMKSLFITGSNIAIELVIRSHSSPVNWSAVGSTP